MPSRLRAAAAVALAALLAAGLCVAAFPEPPARPLTGPGGWALRGGGERLGLQAYPRQYLHLRRSVAASPGAFLHRSWSPDGVREVSLVSPPFRATPHLSIPINGATRTWTGRNRAYLTCSTHPRTLPIFTGSVNVNLAEALVDVPRGWCDGDVRAVLEAGDLGVNVGVGTVFAVSALSAWKSSFVGLLPYLALAMTAIAAFGLAGAAAARRRVPAAPAPVAAAIAIGLASLAAFLVGAIARAPAVVTVVALAALAALWRAAGRQRVREAAAELAPYGKAWAAACLGYFALLAAGRNGLGHWESHYRFWPAAWSSDAELPWMFAEALRTRMRLADVLSGWRITDRPPLLTGGHLLVADLFDLLQLGNDGRYLRGLAYDAGAIAFNALWVPAVLFVLVAVLRQPRARALLVVATVAVLPFSIFNTTFGWAKAFGAAFGVLAAAVAVQAVRERATDPGALPTRAALFGTLGALSLLCHGSGAFLLLPVGAWLLVRALARRPAALAAGVIPGAALVASWAIYQRIALPSAGPLTKYALTGDFGFGSPRSLLEMVVERYRGLTLGGWLDIKGRMLLQPLIEIDQPFAQMHLSDDHGADLLGALRAWDFCLVSAGNVAILLGGALALVLSRRRAARAEAAGFDAGAARTLLAFAGVTWLVLALVFLAPIVLITWPYAAVFVAAAAGLGWLAEASPAAFAALAGASALYSAVVWVVGGLRAARDVDPVAAGACLLVVAAVGLSLRRPDLRVSSVHVP